MLLPEELQHGYWGARRLAGLLPTRVIRNPEELHNVEALRIACTQTGLSSTEQRKLVKRWCQVLPQVKAKTLMFETKLNQELFDAATQVQGLQALYIKWSQIRAVDPIKECKSLIALEIGSSPSLTGLFNLRTLPNLKSLRLENVREAQNLDFVLGMKTLEEFGICGSVWTIQRLDNLWPLKDLDNLQLLWLIGARVLYDGLRPLHGHRKLTALKSSFYFSKSEFFALRSATPSLKFGSPFEEDKIEKVCKD